MSMMSNMKTLRQFYCKTVYIAFYLLHFSQKNDFVIPYSNEFYYFIYSRDFNQ